MRTTSTRSFLVRRRFCLLSTRSLQLQRWLTFNVCRELPHEWRNPRAAPAIEAWHWSLSPHARNPCALAAVHDGKIASELDCTSLGCCGGSGTSCSGAVSGVCEVYVDLASCTSADLTGGDGGDGDDEDDVGGGGDPPPPADPLDCTNGGDNYCKSISDLAAPAGLGFTAAHDCAVPQCVDGRCQLVALSSNTVCRPAADDCDLAEVRACSGGCGDGQHSLGQPDRCQHRPGGSCKRSPLLIAAPCPGQQKCDGTSLFCPALDAKKPKGTVCRVADGPCDVAEVRARHRRCRWRQLAARVQMAAFHDPQL